MNSINWLGCVREYGGSGALFAEFTGAPTKALSRTRRSSTEKNGASDCAVGSCAAHGRFFLKRAVAIPRVQFCWSDFHNPFGHKNMCTDGGCALSLGTGLYLQ
jgi:hypothetical protein